MTSTKPYDIAKRTIWEAYQRVKANRGAAGIDEETISMFEQDLSKNLYKLWNRMSSGVVLPAAGQASRNSQGNGRHSKAGRADGGFITHTSQLSFAMTFLEMSGIADPIAKVAALLGADGDPPGPAGTDLTRVDHALLDPVVNEIDAHPEFVGKLPDRDLVGPL